MAPTFSLMLLSTALFIIGGNCLTNSAGTSHCYSRKNIIQGDVKPSFARARRGILLSNNANKASTGTSSGKAGTDKSRWLHGVIGRVRGGVLFEHPPPSPAAADIDGSAKAAPRNNILKAQTTYAFSGQLLPNIRRIFFGSKESYVRGFNAIKDVHEMGDVSVLVIFSLLPMPLAKLIHSVYYPIAVKFGRPHKEFEHSIFSTTGKWVSELGKIASLIYVVELVTAFFFGVLSGYKQAPTPHVSSEQAAALKHLVIMTKFPSFFATSAYGIWIAKKLVYIKTKLLKKFYSKIPDPELYDRVLNFFIFTAIAIIVLDASTIEFGSLLKSLVAIGGISSVVVGLTLKDPATQLVQGALLFASNKFRRNESITLGDGTSGKVMDMGLMETTIMGGDNIQVRIPNAVVANQKVYNLSRMRKSQVKLVLRFNLHDMHRVENVMAMVKQEIVESCPQLIKDGTRPFRVIWTDIDADHIKVTVDTHHDIPPACNAYWENRQKVLLAIARATKKASVRFALPTVFEGKYNEAE
jgi:small-conductance mechanosensitive channel